MHACSNFIVVTKQEILVISLTEFFDAASWHHNDVIYCCQRYAECLVATSCSSRTVHWHTMPCTCNSWTAASRNATLSYTQPVASKQSRSQSVDYKIWAVMQHRVYHRQIHSVDELKKQLIDAWCGLEQSIFDEAIDQWQGRHRACVHAKGGHFEYSLWTDSVDFVHICYIPCERRLKTKLFVRSYP